MKILVINSGSSSLKYQIFDVKEKFELLAKGALERIGLTGSVLEHCRQGDEPVKIKKEIPNHKAAMEVLMDFLTNPDYGVIGSIDEIDGVGHRVVHGGELFKRSVIITQEILEQIRSMSEFAPLHNPANITGIETCQELMPKVPNIAVFDTAINQTMPAKAYVYAMPIEYYEKDHIRKYGFHGTSHGFVSTEAARIAGKDFEKINIITCHLGNGGSITAFKNGKVVDTSMGLTPLEGLVMGTRCGDVDAAAVLAVMSKYNLSPKEMDKILNKKSGLKGLTDKADMRDVMTLMEAGDKHAKLAFEMFIYRVQKYIGAYAAVLNGVDIIVFTGGIGENCIRIRAEILSCFEFMGLKVDKEKNDKNETVFSTDDSDVTAMMVETNEELMIAKDTLELIKGHLS